MWLSIAPVLNQVGVEHVEQTNLFLVLLGRLHTRTTKKPCITTYWLSIGFRPVWVIYFSCFCLVCVAILVQLLTFSVNECRCKQKMVKLALYRSLRIYFTALACCLHQDSSTVWWHAIAGFLLSSIMDLQCLTENLNNQSKLWTEIAMHNRK